MVMILVKSLKHLLKISLVSLFIIIISFQAHGESELFSAKDANISEFTLENGLKVILLNKNDAPYASIQILIGAGSVTEGKYSGSGISHYIEHLLFKGTENRQWEEITRAIESYGGYFNAATSFDTTVYFVTVGNDYVIPTLEILADVITYPLFHPEDLEKEKNVILKEMNMRDDNPQVKLMTAFWQTAYRINPYQYPVIGYKDRFLTLTRKDVLEYYKALYQPENTFLVIAGNLNETEVIRKVREYFYPYGARGFNEPFIPVEPPQLGERRVVVSKDVKLSRLYLGFHTTDMTSDDMYALDTIAQILGAGKDSRLYQNLKEEKELVYGISAGSYTPKYPGLFVISATFDPEKEEEVIEAINKEIDEISQQSVSDEELQKVRNTIIAGYVFGLEKIENYAGNLLRSLFFTGNIDFARYYVDKIRTVKKDDIQRLAKKYFTENNKILAVLRPIKQEDTGEEKTSTETVPVRKKQLANGSVVLLKEDHTLPFVVIRAVMEGGLLGENESDNGISKLFAKTWTKSTKTMNQKEIVNTIESIGGSLGAYSGNNSFGLTIKVLSEHLDKALELFFSVMYTANFPESEIKKEKEILKAAFKAQQDSPITVGRLAFKKELFLNHPYGFNPVGNPEIVEDLTREQIIDYFKKYRIPGNMVFGIWGDFDEDTIMTEIEKYLDKMPKAEGKISLNLDMEKLAKSSEKRIQRKDQEQTIIFLGFLGTDIYSHERFVLTLISTVFSGQGSVLFEKVREKLGASYFVGASSNAGLDAGSFLMYAGTVPGKEKEVMRLLFEELDRVKNGQLSQEEIDRAKNVLIWQIRKGRASLSSQSMEAMLNELYGLGYDYGDKEEEIIHAITPEKIQEVAKKYFNENHVIVIVEPENTDEHGSKSADSHGSEGTVHEKAKDKRIKEK